MFTLKLFRGEKRGSRIEGNRLCYDIKDHFRLCRFGYDVLNATGPRQSPRFRLEVGCGTKNNLGLGDGWVSAEEMVAQLVPLQAPRLRQLLQADDDLSNRAGW